MSARRLLACLAVVSLAVSGCGSATAPARSGPAPVSAPAAAAPQAPSAAAPTTPATGAASSASAPASAVTAAPSPALQQLIAAAREEGQLDLMWSEAVIGGSPAVRRWIDGFAKAYGLDLTVRYTAGPSMAQTSVQLLQEYEANRPATSDVMVNAVAPTLRMIHAGVLQPVDWMSWAPNIRDPQLLSGPAGEAVTVSSAISGITYNTNALSGDAVPRSLADLLKPQYTGRIASTPYPGSFEHIVTPEVWGEPRTVEYLTSFRDQVAGLMPCGQWERVASGEFDLFALDCGAFEAGQAQAKGAPIAQVVPADAIIVQQWYVSVPKNAAHPNAAKLWINYLLSREAQDIQFETYAQDLATLPGSRSAVALEAPRAAGGQVHDVNVAFLERQDASNLEAMSARLGDIINRR
ncbi:MAG TPA: ABC transporter substrate-binding protein [Chloroflexota bacterium]|nr:ABC transporter substrate-binding protein [Chloroflexota bacterium]